MHDSADGIDAKHEHYKKRKHEGEFDGRRTGTAAQQTTDAAHGAPWQDGLSAHG
jgi:hypothetical protein